MVLVTALGVAWALRFLVPGFRATGGAWPVPLDDVYIHFDHARAFTDGAPGAWIAGQGYSSGETAPLYAAVLAVGHWIGFHDQTLAYFAGGVALASFVSLARSLGELARPAPRWAAWVAAAPLVGLGWLGWSWWSGMEVALFGAIVARAVAWTARARAGELRPGERRAALAWRAGVFAAACVLVRPEAIAIAPWLAVAAGRGAKDRSGLAQAARVVVPALATTAAVALVNRALTGSFASAGAQLKLLTSNPYLDDAARAREVVLALLHFGWTILGRELGALGPAILALAASAVVARRSRDVAIACLGAAITFALLTSVNGAARHQNFRYYAPAAILALLACAQGVAAWARAGGAGKVVAALVLAASASGWRASEPEVARFAGAASDVERLQVELGRWLFWNTRETDLLLVGDAGAVPYVSTRHAIDALGLGGYRGVPFAKAAPHGEAAMLELLERLPPAERPTHLALFPNWFPETTARFGRPIHAVTVERPTIAAGATKVAYAADFTALRGAADRPPWPGDVAPGPPFAEIDVADVLSEEAARYVHPTPNAGFAIVDVREGTFDGGRVVPEGREESFDLPRSGPAVLLARVGDAAVEVEIVGVGRLALDPPTPGRYRYGRATLPAGPTRVTVRAAKGELRSFHYWAFRAQ